MKILFFISVHGHGRGGHFHSLNHISRKLGEHHEIRIISFGPGRSNVIENNPNFQKHIPFKGFDFFKLKRIIKTECFEFNPDIYHCFDEGSYDVIRLMVSSNKHKLVLNKCGGPNPIRFSYINNLILFSKENFDWFNSHRRFENSVIRLIPNRVEPLRLLVDYNPIEKTAGEFVFMRICRIGSFYQKGIEDSINLIKLLIAKGLKNVKLYVIGVVQDKKLFDEFCRIDVVEDGNVVFLTAPEFTNEASKMLYLADAVIGTGRGLMEAASLGKPILTIDKNGHLPVLLNEDNFSDAFKTNFSERNCFENFSSESYENSISQLVQNKTLYFEAASFASECFIKYFDINKVIESYPETYSQSKTGKRKILGDSLLILKSLINFYRSHNKLKEKN